MQKWIIGISTVEEDVTITIVIVAVDVAVDFDIIHMVAEGVDEVVGVAEAPIDSVEVSMCKRIQRPFLFVR